MKCHGRVLWSLVIGLGLTLGLSSAFALYPVARVHAVRPDFVAEPGDDAIGAASGESTIQRPAVGPQSPEASHLRALARPAAVQPGPPTLGVPRDGVRPLAPPMPGVTDLAICLDSRRVWGIVGAGETVTVSVNGAQMGAARANNLGFFWTTLYDTDGNRPGLGAGDTVAIYHDGVLNASITLRDISGQVDVVNDVVSGTLGGSGLPISVTVYAPSGEPSMTSYSQTVSTDGAGNFTADFSGVWDFVIWDEATVAYVDGPVEVHQHVYAAESLLVRPWPFNGVMGFTAPGATVTATLYFSDTTEKASAGLTAYATGWYYWGVPDDVLESDYVVVEFEGGTVLSRTVGALSVNVDAANDRVTGVAEPGAVVRGRPWGGVLTPLGRRETQTSTTADPTGVYTLEFGLVGDIMPGQWFGVFVADAEGDDLNTWHHAPSVDVNQTTNEVSGYAVSPPGPLSNNWPVTLTLYSAADDTTHVHSKGMGWYGWYRFGGDDGLPDIAPGDVVTVESESFAWQGVVQVMTMTVEADPDADRFTGEVVSPTGRVELSGHYWQGQLYPAGGQLDMLVTATSPFTAAPAGFDVNGDLSYDVAHRTTGEYVERISRRTDGFGTTLNSSGFGGVLNPPGVAYTFTLYNSGGNLKTQVTGNSPEPDGNLGWIGFGGTGQRVEAGDYVQMQSAAGFSHTVQIPALSINGDPDADIVYGQGPANTLLYVRVGQPWNNPPYQGFVPTDESGRFTVTLGQLQQVWGNGDLQWGDELVLTYYDEKNTWLNYEFRLPAPEVSVRKSTISGFARPGGKYVYIIQYWNDGTGVATDTLIVDTLPLSTTYAGDTSGVTPEIGAHGVITWRLGNLPPRGNDGNWGVFAVTVDVADTIPDGGSLSPNCVTISTSAPGDSDPGNDTSCAGPVDVWDSDVGVNIDKWPHPGDPTPGQEFEYHFRWCTDRGANFGPVWLTDTLPVSTTLLDWWTDWPWNMWTEVITTGGQFVLYAPGLPGDYCQQTYLRLLLDPDVPLGTLLQNTIVITTPGDVDPNNNQEVNTDARVGPPRYDMNTDKWFVSGVLVPGGWIDYHISYWNQGNSAVHAWLTDTLPEGTTYRPGSAREEGGGPAFPPAIVTDEYVVWDLGVIGVNQGYGLDFTLDVSATVTADTVLTNCAAIGGDFVESTPADNIDCVAVTINDPGPNLRVTKRHEWHGDGQLGYRIYFYNLGDETITDVWITDTLPADTAWDGWWNLNFDWGRLAEQSLTSDVLAWRFSELYPGDNGSIEFNANLAAPGAPLRWYTNTVEIAPLANDTDPTDNTYTDVAFSGGEVQWVDFDVYRTRVWGCAPQGPVTVTTALAEMTFGGNCWDEQNFPDTFDPGDVVTITAGAGRHPVVVAIPDPFTGYINSDTNTVWGQIDALDHQLVHVDLWGFPSQRTTTDAQGQYSVTYPDIPHGAQGDLGYWAEIDYARVGFHHRLVNLDLSLNINYDHDWVEGNYESGHTVWLTVTNGLGVIRATAELTTGVIPWWGGGQTGFSTNLNDPWQPHRPDIRPGDWVYGATETGYTATVQLGLITGVVDVDADRITGTVNAPWLMPGPVDVECYTWGAPGGAPNKRDSVIPDGNDIYTCAWDPNTEWDVWPWQDIGVSYREPDGHHIFAAFRASAPRLRVEKWLDGGNPGEGGNAIFYVQYRNEGDGAAENVVITDTLQGMTFITDTSGFAHTGSGDEVVWQLGTVPPGDWIHFYVFAEVNAAAGERVTNTVQIATSNPYDQGDPSEKWREWSGEVQPNDTHLNVGKGAWTGDPAPGTDFVYNINVCNNGSTASSQVTLTDTLHLSTTLRSWWAREPGWTEVFSDAQTLVLSKPTIPGGQCHEVYLRVYLDENAWPGMSISNTATIYAANDLSTGDDETTWWGNVNHPRTNLNIHKAWDWGQLTPGGELHYNINYQNTGNVPVAGPIRITDTLPISTTFTGISNFYGGPSVTPLFTGTDYVVFEIAGLDNGYSGGFQVALRVDSAALPGALLTNTVEIEPQPDEDNTDDNISTAVETLYPHGPNLRVTKWGDWHGDRAGHAWYQMVVENVGDEPVTGNVTLTDTYPTVMNLEGGVGIEWYAGWWEWRDHPAEHYFTVTVEPLEPGRRARFNFNAQIPGPDAVPGGLILTNTVTVAPVAGDTHPADDRASYVLTTGPDLWIEKDLVAGTLRPGELITFSLRFGNDRAGWQWWWQLHGNAVLTDTMPAGFEYVGAVQHWCGWTEWCEHEPDRREGQQAVWDLWPLHAEEWNELYVTFRITDTATGLDTFINRAEIASTEPVSDAEVYTGNNAAEYTVVVDLPYFQVSKVYESSRIAGAVVTYTLTVTNVGNAIATGVIVTDALPAHLTDHSGTAGLPWIGWWVESIVSGGAATLDFYATLPCTAGLSIINADYGVRASDQGVSSPAGAPVSFDVIEPNITATLVRAPESIVAGETVYFTATAGTNGTPLSYAWAFGDGATEGGGLTAWHVYTRAGVYTAIFTATDGCGYTGVATATVTVVPACNPVTGVSFTYAPANPAIRTAVVFTAAVTPTDAGAPVTYVWSFGDGAAGAGQAVNHTYALSDSYTVVVTATNCAGAGLATYTENVAVRLVEGGQTPVYPATGGTLVYTDSQGNPTVVHIPGGAVSQAITLLLTPVVSPTQPAPSGLRFAHHTFDLEAYLGYTLLSGFVFSRPLTVTIHYSNADVHGLDESDLRLYYWTGGAWADVINTCTPPSSYTRDLLQNVLGVPLCHLTRFGVMSRALQNVYLPLVMRSY